MTAAHQAGLARIPLAILATYALLEMPEWGRPVAALMVALAALTDFLDGFLARRLGTVSELGAVMDQTTDKVFVIPVLFVAARGDSVLLWMAVLIAIRDLLVMGVRVYAAGERAVVPSSRLGKWKTILLYPALLLVVLGDSSAVWGLAIATAATVVSGVAYIMRARPLLARGMSARSVASPLMESRR